MFQTHFFLWILISVGVVSIAQAEVKLTPLKTGGGRPLESLKAKKEPKIQQAPSSPVKDEAPPPAPVFRGPKKGWGIVNPACIYYSSEGHNMGTLPAGTLIDYQEVKHSTKGFVLVSKVQRQANTWEGPFLVEVPDVVLFSGELDKLPKKLISDLKAYYTLQGQIVARKEVIEEKSQSQNPYFESAKLWQSRYGASMEKARAMEEKANALNGPAKSKMLDDLRSMKYEQVRVKLQADKEAASYKAWKDQHPIDPALVAQDSEMKELRVQLKAAEEKIKGFIVDQ